jgi:diguanylate cyclase (GGDEF)-like protein
MLVEIGALQLLANEAGPEMAQKVVRRFAAILRKTLKGSDFVAHTSPQHFAIIFEKLLPEHAATIALRIHKAMEASMSLGKDPVMKLLSVTIGITNRKPEDKTSAELLARGQASLVTARKQVGAGIYMA